LCSYVNKCNKNFTKSQWVDRFMVLGFPLVLIRVVEQCRGISAPMQAIFVGALSNGNIGSIWRHESGVSQWREKSGGNSTTLERLNRTIQDPLVWLL
jgi:hypothetical protein